jgi:hypothetical protein
LTSQYIDFHCNSAFNNDYDARIACSGGTALLGQGDLTISGNSLTVGTSTSTATLNGTVNIVSAGGAASAVNILSGAASTGTLTVGSSTSTATINGTVNLGTAGQALTTKVPLTLDYGTADITGANQQGYNSIASVSVTTACGSTDTVIRTIALTAGVWMIQGCLIWSTITLGQVYVGLSPTALVDNLCVTQANGNGTDNIFVSVSRFAVVPTATTYRLIGRSFTGASTVILTSLNAVRIA